MTNCRDTFAEELHWEEEAVSPQRSTEVQLVDQVPVLLTLPELATVASQRDREKKWLRGQTGRLRVFNWRRLSVGLGGNMVVGGFLLALTAATYWGLSGGSFESVVPGSRQATVQDDSDDKPRYPNPVQVTLWEEFPAEAGVESGQQSTEASIGSNLPSSADVVIVQPLDPVLSARRKETPPAGLTEGEIPQSLTAPR